MKSRAGCPTFHLPAQVGFVNITPQAEEAMRKSGVAEGLALDNAMRVTASAFINDDEHRSPSRHSMTESAARASLRRRSKRRTGSAFRI